MKDSFQVASMSEFCEVDHYGKPLGKQAAFVLAEYICRTTKELTFVYKNELSESLGAFEWDEMTSKTFFQPLVNEATTVYVKDYSQDYYILTIRGYVDVREYVNLHEFCEWDKEAMTKQRIPQIRVSKGNRQNLIDFINYLKKAGCKVKGDQL